MIKKLIVSFSMFVLSFLFIGSLFIEAESIEVDASNKSESLDISNGNDHNVYFDCDSVFETNKNKINIRLIDDYKIIPNISGNGNISFSIISSDYCLNEFELLLPQEDGKLELILQFGDELVRKNVFSSYKDGVYGVSISSLYSARQLVGNLPNQEYMDNDSRGGEFVLTPESDSLREPNNRGGKVCGYLRWEDDNNNLHALVGVKLRVMFNVQYYTYTNSSGYYEFPLGNYSGSFSLHIYSKNEKIEVINENDFIYEKTHNSSVLADSTYTYNYDFVKTDDFDLASGMQVFAAASNFANYAESVVSSTLNGTVPLCHVRYPYVRDSDEPTGCFYSVKANIGTIHLCPESERVQGCPSVAGSWDTIGHEYAHHLQRNNFYTVAGGDHYNTENCLYTSIRLNGISNLYDSNIPTIKTKALKLGFKEAWATFFSIVAQKSFSVGNVPTVGDDVYKAYNNVVQNLSISNVNDLNANQGGESDELVIMRILFKLWDNSQEPWDTISFSFNTIWNFMYSNNPINLYDFINKFYTNPLFSYYINGINLILENYGISPNNLQIDQTNNYYVQPTFTWNSGNKDVDYNNLTFRFSNTRFNLEFYTPNGDLLFETGSIYVNTYTLTESQWNQILLSNISSYKIKIKGYAPYGFETGAYCSSIYSFNKPTGGNNVVNVNISNSRYYENSFVILAGTHCQFNITFDHSGNKLIQTFGSSDTKMWLYDSNNNQIAYNDDYGHQLNPLFYLYLNNNTTYKLIIKLLDNTLTASTKLSIISYGGDFQNNDQSIVCFEDIYKLGYFTSIHTYQTYVNQYEATVVIWQPSVTGCYTVELSSSFDNYLYVIDPTSSNYLIEDEDYNDDYCIDDDQGLYTPDAKLYGYYYSNKTYMIVINQSNPSGSGGNINLIIDFLM